MEQTVYAFDKFIPFGGLVWLFSLENKNLNLSIIIERFHCTFRQTCEFFRASSTFAT